jgi:hypothetical protein
MSSRRVNAARIGVVALLAAMALPAAAAPATAQEALPNLSLSFDSEPVADITTNGKTIGMYLYNNGQAPATRVQVRLDLAGLSDQVEATVPDYAEGCALDFIVVTCELGGLQPGEVGRIFPLTLASKQGAPPGPAGSVFVAVALSEEDADPSDNTATFPVTILTSGPDLVALAADVNTEDDPVGPGDIAPVYAALLNEGDAEAPGFAVHFDVPTGSTFYERYDDCTYRSHYKKDGANGFVYGPTEVTCVAPLPLAPGEGVLLFDEESGVSIFNLRFGKNLAGPERTQGTFDVALADPEQAAAARARAATGGGKTFAAAAAALRDKSAARGVAGVQAALEELDTGDNYVEFGVFTKPNTFDVSVKVTPVTGKVGDTVAVAYAVTNNGPSDGGGPGVLITAPTGTALLPAEWCYTDGTDHEQRPESAKLRCNFESIFPTTHSGGGVVRATVRVKIKSTPGADGTVVVSSSGPSTESKPDNNTAKIVINPPGGGGGGLPVTGTPVGLIALVGAALVLLGAALYRLVR